MQYFQTTTTKFPFYHVPTPKFLSMENLLQRKLYYIIMTGNFFWRLLNIITTIGVIYISFINVGMIVFDRNVCSASAEVSSSTLWCQVFGEVIF